MKKVDEFPKLNSFEFLEGLRQKYGFNQYGGDNTFLLLGGLRDYIYKTPKSQLVGWALACESFEREGKTVLGGLHDYVNTLSVDQLAEYILARADKHEELNAGSKLDALAKKYGFGQ